MTVRALYEALEASPVPSREWPSLLGTLGLDLLTRLLGVSASSIRRYASGARRTPDDAAVRRHFLALVVGELAGAYTDIGVRRWFDRPRTALSGRAPSDLLTGGWLPEDEGAARVRKLAAALGFSPAT